MTTISARSESPPPTAMQSRPRQSRAPRVSRAVAVLFMLFALLLPAVAAKGLKVVSDEDLLAGLFSPNYADMTPNATYNGVPGIFIPIEPRIVKESALATTLLPTTTTTTTTSSSSAPSTTIASTTTVTPPKTTSSTTTRAPGEMGEESPAERPGFLFGGWRGNRAAKSTQAETGPTPPQSTTTTLVIDESDAVEAGLHTAAARPTPSLSTTGLEMDEPRPGPTLSSTITTKESVATRKAMKGLWGFGFGEEESSTTTPSSRTARASATTQRRTVKASAEKTIVTSGDPSKVDSMIRSVELLFSHLPKQPLPKVDYTTKLVNVKLYADEPCLIGAYSQINDDVFVDLEAPVTNMTGALGRHSWVQIVPRGAIGSTETLSLYLSDTARNSVTKVDVVAELVDSVSPLVAHVSVNPGRLDPPFKPYNFAYHIRVPEHTKSFVMEFSAKNDRNAQCTIDGTTFYTGTGKFYLQVPPRNLSDQRSLTLTCYGADKSNVATYLFNIVPQYGGETTLKGLEAIGAPFNTVFDPLNPGVYTADMIRGAQLEGVQEMEWTQIRAIPSSSKAIVKVDGHLLKNENDYLSDWYRIPRGSKRRAVVTVRTEANPVSEEYIVDLSREVLGAKWWQTVEGLTHAGRLTALTSFVMGSSKAYHLMNSMKTMQMYSVLGRIPLVPESWNTFASPFNTFNLQPSCCAKSSECCCANQSVTVHAANTTGHRYPHSSPDMYDGAPVSPYIFNWLESPSRAANDQFDMDLFGIESSPVYAFDVAADRWSQQDASHLLPHARSLNDSARRRLSRLSGEDRQQLIIELEGARKAYENVVTYATLITVVTAGILIIDACYLIVWIVYLRAPPAKEASTDGSDYYKRELDGSHAENFSGANTIPGFGLSMRPDFPSVLHPIRFATFVLDFAFVAYVQASVGILVCSSADFNRVEVFTIPLPMVALKGIAACLLMSCVAFIMWGSACLMRAQARVSFGGQFCEYHDTVVTQSKALWKPQWTRFLPVLDRLFCVEISAVAPIQSASDRQSQAVVFEQTEAAAAQLIDLSQNYEQGYNRVSGAGAKFEPAPMYSREADAIEVAINDRVYTDMAENYDRRNADLVAQYPDAKIGETSFLLQNAYGYPLILRTDLQLKHLTCLMQIMDNFPFWLPRDNCQMPIKDSLFNLLSSAGRGLLLDWTVNRVLLFITLTLSTLFANSSVFTSLLVVIVFSGLSALIRTPSTASTGMARYERDLTLWEQELGELQQADEAAREAEQVWPFNEPGFSERFRQVRQRKQDRLCMGLAGLARSLCGTGNHPSAEGPPNQGFLRSAPYYVLKEFALSLVMADILICLAGVCLLFGRRTQISPVLPEVLAAMILCVTSLVLINMRSMALILASLASSANALLLELVYWSVATRDAFFGIGGVGARLTHFGVQFGKLLSGDPTFNWHFPKAGRSLRRFPVDKVKIVSNELGMHLPAIVGEPSPFYKMSVSDANRLKIFKTLVINGGLGHSRKEIYRSLPLQVPFGQLFRDEPSEDCVVRLNNHQSIDRLVGTVQIVNHTFRANAAGLPIIKHSEHDSFLSLYALEDFFPSPGKIRLRKSGHTYSLRYDSENSQIVVRGPSILAGRRYSLRTTLNQPRRTDMYQNVTRPNEDVSDDSIYPEPTAARATTDAFCEAPGTLRVQVEGNLAPDLYKTIELVSPAGSVIFIPPMQIKVHYDLDCGELFLRHEDLVMSPQPYTVKWHVRPANPKPISASGIAAANGAIYFPVESSETPDLISWVCMRDENDKVIDIDPKQTDAYQFFFPEKNINRFFPAAFRTLVGRTKSVLSFISGEDVGAGLMEEPIPCTVIQCVNPLERVFRVDPDFYEAHRVFNARLHEFRARQKAIESEAVSSLWPSLMRPQEYVTFWKNFDVNIVDPMGNIVDPIGPKADHQMFHEKFKNIALGDSQLRVELSKRIDKKCGDVEQQMDKVRVWIRAYDDSNLHTSQLNRDLADWSLAPQDKLTQQTMELAEQKQLYEQMCDDFVYPCNIPDVFIGKRPNLSAQFRIWSDILQSWFLFEEGGDVGTSESKARISNVVHDVMQSLKFTIYSNEIRSLHAYRSILHYVVGSQTLRGLNTLWCPDSLRAHPACVRAWTMKEDEKTADFENLPERIPCLLRLTPNALQILMPNGGDLSRVCRDDAYPWQRNTGLYIPLHAFQKFELQRHAELPLAASDPKPFENMTTKLICRKNQRSKVDDGYVRRMEGDQIGNDITFDDVDGRSVRFCVMVGHCVSPQQAARYPDEVDHSIQAPEVNIHPLTFSMNPAFADDWERAISMAHLHTPHHVDFDGVINEDEEPSARSPRPQTPLPISPPKAPAYVSSSSSPSSSSSSSSPDLAPAPDSPVAKLPSEPSLREREPSPDDFVLYSGGLKSNEFDGTGTLRDTNGNTVYTGEWKSGLRHGRGRYRFADGKGIMWEYEGEFSDDVMVGSGKVRLVDPKRLSELHSLSPESPSRMTVVGIKGTLPPLSSGGSRSPGRLGLREAGVPPFVIESIFESPEFAPDAKKLSKYLNEMVASEVKEDGERIKQFAQSMYVRKTGETHEMIVGARALNCLVEDAELLEQLNEDVHKSQATRSRLANPLALMATKYLPHHTRWRTEIDPKSGQPSLFSRFSEGQVRYADGGVYEGETISSVMHGKGRYYHAPSTVRCEPSFDSGKPHGFVVLESGDAQHKNLCLYHGTFRHGLRSGEGVQTSYNGRCYVAGTWEDDKLKNESNILLAMDRGFAKEAACNFTTYEGRIDKMLPNGPSKNTVKFMNGMQYTGGFVDGVRSGVGEIRDKSGNVVFLGNFREDLPEGPCMKYVLSDNTVYCGNMAKGARQGMGELYRVGKDGKAEKTIYEGLWFGDRPHGRGMYFGPDGEYDGEWKNGKRHGKGRIQFKEQPLTNGKSRVYEGDWDKDVPHGVGKYLSEAGKENVYKFNKGELVGESVNQYKRGMCGSAPKITVEPTVIPAIFETQEEKEASWGRQQTAVASSNFRALIPRATEENMGWSLYKRRCEFVGPEVPIDLLRVSRTTKPDLPETGALAIPITDSYEDIPTVPTKAIVKVFLVEGRNLKTGSKSDPYVKITYGSGRKQTKHIKNGGPNAKINKTLMFPAEDGIDSMSIEVWDHDTGRSDDLIGRAEYSLRELMKVGEQIGVVVPLQNVDNRGRKEERGALVMSLFKTRVHEELTIKDNSSQSTNRSEDAARGPHARITIHAATRIVADRGVDIEPFVRVNLGHKEASTAVGSGVNIAYDETLCLPWNGDHKITFTVVDQPGTKKGKPQIIGRSVLDLKTQPQFSGELNLENDNGASVGSLDVSVTLIR